MKVEKRKESLKDVRANNKVPGVIFGKTIEPESIQVDNHELKETLKQYGHTQAFKITIGKKSHQVYIKEIQTDIINPNIILNVKLQKVTKDDTIKASVPLNIIGRESVEKPGVLLHILSDSVEVEYPVGKGVSHLDLDISGLEIGGAIHVKDLTLPEGLEILEDMDKVLIHLSEITLVEEEEEESEEEAPLEEPEVIKQKSEE